jgi:S-adenosylmethionine:tRNA ribosyltransferase-isomerase
MRTDLFDYTLPPELIAQTPAPRGESRLLVLRRTGGSIAHRQFSDIVDLLDPSDTLVLNDTRVSARRLVADRGEGRTAEVLLVKPVADRAWEALVRPGRALKPGKQLTLQSPEGADPVVVQVVGSTPEGGRIIEFSDRAARDAAGGWGDIPLPPYIGTALPHEEEDRYQTVYAAHNGSAAAPTAGLHFTEPILERIAAKGIRIARLTLHVGVGTFRPVRTDDIEAHEMHAEHVTLSQETAELLNSAPGRIVAAGTTTVRALESAGQLAEANGLAGRVAPFTGPTSIFITPGYGFRAVDALITNFHLPRSTLIMLVSALAGHEAVMHAYEEAVRERYRFFSFGDAMLVI